MLKSKQLIKIIANQCSKQTRGMSYIKDIEEFAINKLEPGINDYLNRGAQNDVTLEANKEAFSRLRIRPRYLVDVSKRDLSIKLFGDTVRMPVCVSPFGLNRRFHPNGELETAKGIKESGTIMIVSAGASIKLEEIAAAQPQLIKWFQLFIFKNREMTLDMARRAHRSGYKALVLTIDQMINGIRSANIKNKYEDKEERANYKLYGATKDVALNVTWDDVKWLKEQVPLPLILKGVLTAEDARLAVDCGVDAIFVSNHGGRQIDGSPATLEALPEIVDEVDNKVDVFVDGGVRSGTDVFKALAIGAKAVFVGRPVCWGLIYNGSDGVKQVLDTIYDELDTNMTIAGCPTVSHINRSHVRYVDEYIKQLKNKVK